MFQHNQAVLRNRLQQNNTRLMAVLKEIWRRIRLWAWFIMIVACVIGVFASAIWFIIVPESRNEAMKHILISTTILGIIGTFYLLKISKTSEPVYIEKSTTLHNGLSISRHAAALRGISVTPNHHQSTNFRRLFDGGKWE